MLVIDSDRPSEKEIQWLSENIGERISYLPNYVSGKGWRFRRAKIKSDRTLGWTLEFDDDKMASYYILKYK